MDPTTRDHALMQRLAAGDETALAELVARWQGPLVAHVSRFLGCPAEEAQDVAQEAFLRVWRERRRWQPKAAFSTWLFTVALNLCRNLSRSARRRPELVSITPGEEGGAPLPLLAAGADDDPFARARAAEVARVVRAAIAALPQNQRSALLLRRFEGMSYRQIGEVLGLSQGAVESLLVRARRSLVEALRRTEGRGAQETGVCGVEGGREG